MFKHQGKNRTLKHNLQIASVLSLVAGIVNVVGFLAITQLTTNVTGHFALFIYDVAHFEFWKGTIYLLYILSFLAGSFSSSILIETFKENQKLNVFVLPTLIECLILISVAVLGSFVELQYPNLIACLLLFAMGLQNAYVTKISNATVRTTHLTGLFTDLGIDLSHMFTYKSALQRSKLKSAIKLRLYIISFFFGGGLIGGFLYSKLNMELHTLFFAAAVLLISLFYDEFRFHIIKTKRKHR